MSNIDNRGQIFTYDWQEVLNGKVPRGMEVNLPLDGGVTRARIPSKWQLKLELNINLFFPHKKKELVFWRFDIERYMKIKVIRRALAQFFVSSSPDEIQILVGRKASSNEKTVEELDLWGRQKEVKILRISSVPACISNRLYGRRSSLRGS